MVAGHRALVKLKLTSKMHDHEIRLCLPGCICQHSFARPWQRAETPRALLSTDRVTPQMPASGAVMNGFLLKANPSPLLLFPLQRPGALAAAARPLPPSSWGCCKLFSKPRPVLSGTRYKSYRPSYIWMSVSLRYVPTPRPPRRALTCGHRCAGRSGQSPMRALRFAVPVPTRRAGRGCPFGASPELPARGRLTRKTPLGAHGCLAGGRVQV